MRIDIRSISTTVMCNQRFFSSHVSKTIPVITVPKYLEPQIKRVKFKIRKEEVELQDRANRIGNRNVLVISSKMIPKLNHYLGQTYRKGSPLISTYWKKAAYKNDEMVFHAIDRDLYKFLREGNDENEENAFLSLGLNQSIVDAMRSSGIKYPTEIQLRAIPEIIGGKNVQITSETGSGKTLAYLAPIMHRIREIKMRFGEAGPDSPFGLIVVPSRELADQVGSIARDLGLLCGIGVAVAIGGMKQNIPHTGFDLLVTTMGLLEAHLTKKLYNLQRTQHLVLDEADTLLDDSFNFTLWDLLPMMKFKDTESGLGSQLVLVSATIPAEMEQLLNDVIDMKSLRRVKTDRLHHVMTHVKQRFLRLDKTERTQKILLLAREALLKKRPTVIFCTRSKACNYIYHHLNEHDVPCLRLNKHMPPEERADSFKRFQYGERDILVATDLGSRGLDTKRVTNIINFECPKFVADYIHRAGRTGRCGSSQSCSVTTFITYKADLYMLMELENAVRNNMRIDNVSANIKKLLRDHYSRKMSKREQRQN